MRTTLAVCVALVLAAAPSSSVEPVSAGYAVDQVSVVEQGRAPRLETISDSRYGDGVMAAVVSSGFLVVERHADSGRDPFAVLGPFNEKAELLTVRFDRSGLFANELFVSIAHDGGFGGQNVVTSLYAISPSGEPRLLETLGSPASPQSLTFDFSDGSRGYEAGIYLQDRKIEGGTAMVHLDPSLAVSSVGKNFVPRGRKDLDVRAMRFDPTGLYSSYLFMVDADDHDRLSGVYLLDPKLQFTEVTRFESLRTVSYSDLAFSAGGVLDLGLYVAERVGNRILLVSPTGGESEFASGFNRIESIAIADDGSALYAADRDAIYRIREGADPGNGGS